MENFKPQFHQKSTLAPSGRRQELGASTIFILGFLPLFCSLLFAVLAILTTTQAKMIPLQICRKENLKLQEQAQKSIDSLLKLNPLVLELRANKKMASIALAAATVSMDPPAVAAAEDWLATINASMTSLKANQLYLLSLQSMSALKNQTEANLKSKTEIEKLSRSLAFFLEIQLQSYQSPLHHLALKPDIRSEEPAIYERQDQFPDKESSHSFWILNLVIDHRHWLKNFFHNRIRLKGECKASLFEEHGQWIPALNR